MKEKLNPKVNEQILNMGGNCYVKEVISDCLVIAEYFGIQQLVKIVGRAPNISYHNRNGFHGELCAG